MGWRQVYNSSTVHCFISLLLANSIGRTWVLFHLLACFDVETVSIHTSVIPEMDVERSTP